MLVIRRRRGESILLGPDIEIEVLEASGSQVKLGIRAPRSVSVVRKEILLIGEQNRTASGISEAAMQQLVSAFNRTNSPANKLSSPSPADR